MAKRPVTHDLSTFGGRLRAWLHFYLKDHHLLRVFWWNLDEVAPGVWRSNQPSPGRLARYKALGIENVVSLRGALTEAANQFEAEACARLGLSFSHAHGLTARELPAAATLLEVVDRLAEVDGPMVIHCKSGADRTGLAAALYLIIERGQDVAEVAAEQLRPGRIHFPRSRAGVISHLFRYYLRDVAPSGMGFRDWLEAGYDRAAITADFQDWRAGVGRWAT